MQRAIEVAGSLARHGIEWHGMRPEFAAESAADDVLPGPQWRGKRHGWTKISMITRQVLRRAVGEIVRPLP